MYRISYTSSRGRVWQLESGKNLGVFLAPEGLDGMVGDADDNVLTSVGIPGQRLSTLTIKPLTGALTVNIVKTPEHSVEQLFARWHSDWSRHTPGTLTIATDTAVFTTKTRLAAALPPAKKQPKKQQAFREVTAQIIADSGVWNTQPITQQGPSITIHNPGDIHIYPRITWEDRTTITLPSRATIDLPEVAGPHTISLDPLDSRIVTDSTGNPNRPLWEKLSRDLAILPEGIPPGHTRTFHTSNNTTAISYQLGFLDPWRG